MKCILVAMVIQCTGTAPALTPAEAAAILAPNQYVAPVQYPGPIVTVAGTSKPTLGPWDFPLERPRVRLDGTPLTQPPDVYGIPWAPYGFFGGFRPYSERRHRDRQDPNTKPRATVGSAVTGVNAGFAKSLGIPKPKVKSAR